MNDIWFFALFTLHIQFLYVVFSLYFIAFSVSLHWIFTLFTLHIQFLYIVFSLYFIVFSISLHWIFTFFPLSFQYLYITFPFFFIACSISLYCIFNSFYDILQNSESSIEKLEANLKQKFDDKQQNSMTRLNDKDKN